MAAATNSSPKLAYNHLVHVFPHFRLIIVCAKAIFVVQFLTTVKTSSILLNKWVWGAVPAEELFVQRL